MVAAQARSLALVGVDLVEMVVSTFIVQMQEAVDLTVTVDLPLLTQEAELEMEEMDHPMDKEVLEAQEG